MIHYQLKVILTGMLVTALNPNIVRLHKRNSTNPITDRALWSKIQSDNDNTTFYICNALYGTCLGTLHPVEEKEVLVAENKSLATDQQLLWYYNSTDTRLVSVTNPNMVLDTIYATRELEDGVLQFHKRVDGAYSDGDQQFEFVEENF